MRARTRICPDCHLDLKVADRHGVEIDFCPQCRGVWLERGELDKILAREDEWAGARLPDRTPAYRRDDDDDDDDRFRPRPAPGYGHAPHPSHAPYPPHRKKREGFLGELFDIFD